MESPFRVSADTLAALPAKPAGELVRRMILAEAGSARVGPDQVRTGGRPGSPDGGADFEVRDAPQDSDGGLIKKGHTLYRVRPGAFSPTRDVQAILFESGGELRDPVRECLEAGGTLAVVLTRWGGSNAARSGLEERFAGALRGRLPASAGGSVRVWDAGGIAGLLDAHPQLALYANGASDGLRTHDDWSELGDMSHAFRSGREQEEFIRELRAHLGRGGPVHVRVSGEPGSGKTRMVLEATRDDGLRGDVAYADGPCRLVDVIKYDRRAGEGGAILVVDDCGYSEQARIWSDVKNSCSIRLVTIHSEEDQGLGETVNMKVPPLGGEQLRGIISAYAAAECAVDEWARYCKASPRAAHIVGASLADGRGSALRPLDAAAVWDRHIAGRDGPRGDDFRVRRTVLTWLSLFKEFERGGGGDESEIASMAALIEENEGIPAGRFLGAVDELRRAGVLQGASTLHITPKLLHVHMWAEWWSSHTPNTAPGAGRIGGGKGEGAGAVPGRLLQRHLDMFRYAGESPATARVARDMMRPGGLLDSDGLLGRMLGSDFFLSLGPIDPASTLECIGRIADRAGGGLARVRPGVVGAIEGILVGDKSGGTFARAARLLLRLVAAGRGAREERAFTSNPALDAYCRAFDLAGSRSAAPPRVRLALLAEAMRSASATDRRAAVRACGEALAMRLRSMAIPHCVGFERMPDLWVPRDRAEAASYYAGVVKLLGEAALGDADAGLRGMAAGMAVGTMRQTMIIPGVAPPAASLIESLAAAGAADAGALVDEIDFVLGADRGRIGAPLAARLESLRDSAAGTGLSADLRRLVGRDSWDGGGGAAGPGLGALAGAALREGALERHLGWLAACGTSRAYRLGREVGARDPRLRLLGGILGAMRAAGASASDQFLCGYLEPAAAAGPRRGEIEGMLDEMLGDAALRRHVPAATASAGATDMSLGRLARGVRGGLIEAASLRVLGGGGLLDGASPGAVAELAEAALVAGRRAGADRAAAAAAALGLLNSRFVAGPRPAGIALAPGRLVLDVLLDEGLLGREGGGAGGGEPPDPVVLGGWSGVAAAYAGLGGEGALELAGAMVRRLGDSPLLRAGGPSRPASVLARIATARPREVRSVLAARLGPPAGLDEALPFLEWLGDGGGLGPRRGPGDGGAAARAEAAEALSAALLPWVVEWAASDPGGRAALAAWHLPPHLPSVLGFVARFGGRRDASAALEARLASGGRGGSAAARRAHRRGEALRLAGEEADPGVRRWLEEYAASLGRIARDDVGKEGAPAGPGAREPLAAGAV